LPQDFGRLAEVLLKHLLHLRNAVEPPTSTTWSMSPVLSLAESSACSTSEVGAGDHAADQAFELLAA